MAKADINFEKELWDAANELRGAVSENNYKNYILPLVFLKHLSERYDMVREEINEQLHDPKSTYYSTDADEISYVLEDQDEYRSRNTFVIPVTASWQYLKDNAEQDDIKVKIDDAFDTIQEMLSGYNNQLNNLLPRIFVRSELSAKQTSGIINLLSHPKFSEKENPESDILGRIYEFYIGRFAMAEGSGAGQFFTPGSIVRLLVELLEPYKGRIFDPACGSGGMFVQSLKFIKEHDGDKSDISIYGQEMTAQTLRLCLMNLMLRDLSFDIKLGNSLLDDKFSDLKADYIIANPPFNVSNWHPEDLPEHDPRLFGPREEFTTDGSANYMWMQTFWHHLSDTGTAGIVMANGAMTSNTKGEKNVRQHMVENSMIDAIVRLPDKLFLTTGIPACIFILSKNRDGNDGVHRERNNEILFLDASKMGKMASRKLRVFEDADVAKISETYHNWRTLSAPTERLALSGVEGSRSGVEGSRSEAEVKDKYQDEPGFCKSATISEVQKQDYKLTPGIYVGTEAEEDDLPAPMPGKFFVYVIKCSNDSYYIGQTEDLKRRWNQHVTGKGADWTRKFPPRYIPHHEIVDSREEAVAREKELKTTSGRRWIKEQITNGTARQAGGVPFEDKMTDLKAQLVSQFEKGEELKKQILANFDKIG